jgi:ABC-2 type transport system permease protein
MAGLTQTPIHPPAPPPPFVWTQIQSRAQFTALAQLRWCLFRNNFRRKGGTGELIARIIFLPFLAVIAIGPIMAAGYFGYYLVSSGQLNLMPALTWGIFLLWQLVSINIAPPNLSFDINIIIRFPLSLTRYLTARLIFGLLSAANVIGTLAAVAADIGISVARPSLFPWATLLLATFVLANIFFSRMVFAWIDRWLSTRRAREFLTALILFGSLGFQYLNVTLNPGLQGSHHHASRHLPFLLRLVHHLQPLAVFLPPGLTAASIQSFTDHSYLAAVAALLGLIAFACFFFAVYAWRMQREFRGENLSELTQPAKPTKSTSVLAPAPHATKDTEANTFGLNPVIGACIQKDLLYLRRNTNQLYGFIAPVFMVFLFAGRMASSGKFNTLAFPAAIAYSILGISILSYNCLGMDGAGIQLYFLAPTRLRYVFVSKNLLGFLLGFVEFIIIFLVIAFVSHPPTLLITLSTFCWLIFASLINSAIGNLRSMTSPSKIDLAKIGRKQMSQLSVLIALAVIAACSAIGFGIIIWTAHLHRPWLMIPIFLTLAIVGLVVYLQVLNRVDAIALNHRENLTEVLCKT